MGTFLLSHIGDGVPRSYVLAMHDIPISHICFCAHHHHHYHLDAKRSAEASCRRDRPPERSILCQLQGLGRCDTSITADLVNPGGGWPTTAT